MAVTKTRKRNKYSKKELAEFKSLILAKHQKAKAEYEVFKGNISGDDNHGTDDTAPTFKVLEEGSEVLSKEENAQLAMRQQKFIEHRVDAPAHARVVQSMSLDTIVDELALIIDVTKRCVHHTHVRVRPDRL